MKTSTLILAGLAALVLMTGCTCPFKKTTCSGQNAFEPGKVWLDIDGSVINAHGGGVLYHNGTYYWYGECKGQQMRHAPTPDCPQGLLTTQSEPLGVSCYSSKDLYNWKFEGVVLKTDIADVNSDIHPSKVIERPKVIYNEKTKKFVMWLHIDSLDYKKATAGVAVCDSPTGDFKYLGSMRPNGQMSRDMTLYKDKDGKAYHIYSSEDNVTLYISLLSDDYLKPSGTFTRNFINKSREAPAVFCRDGKYYMLSSGCTGWNPNPAEYAVADSIMGPWKVMGNPCVGAKADITYNAQSTHVIPVEGKDDIYIAMFDRWFPLNLNDSRYIWLPVTFDGDKLTIKWHDKWTLEK